MKTYSVFLGLGSNVGERQKFLNAAVAALKQLSDVKIVWSSSVYETDPYGKTDQPKFLNAALEVATALLPQELLAKSKSIEQAIGRTRSEQWGPREIDIDILMYDGLVYSDEHVTVPHPELPKRKFVLAPLREIAPDLVHPILGVTITELAASCRDSGRVVKTSFHITF
ncbi:MAG: 2-amino-4-hydroxy-6-hydroxymethyldihydropteridine diphosphokinase [Ignavibacteriae bacterium]|nr:2-amino-4-hydroxy-6-hydroxymethyldihydropteridine diphosphokinase [Ignavibacteriota bacterium]